MRRLHIKTKFDEETSYIEIKTGEDLAEYADSLSHNVDNAITRLITSKVPIDRWDHMITRDDQGGVLAGAVLTAQVRGSNPIYELGPMFDGKIASMREYLLEGETVLVNDSGGYCFYNPDYHTILRTEEYTTPDKFKYKINEDTKYINLENDPKLEDNAVNYLKKVDPNYSWVTNLYNIDNDTLVDILKEFQCASGEVVYVYTTGTNVEQMYDYCRCIIDAGIKKVEFKFSATMESIHKEVIRHLEDFNVEVNVL